MACVSVQIVPSGCSLLLILILNENFHTYLQSILLLKGDILPHVSSPFCYDYLDFSVQSLLFTSTFNPCVATKFVIPTLSRRKKSCSNFTINRINHIRFLKKQNAKRQGQEELEYVRWMFLHRCWSSAKRVLWKESLQEDFWGWPGGRWGATGCFLCVLVEMAIEMLKEWVMSKDLKIGSWSGPQFCRSENRRSQVSKRTSRYRALTHAPCPGLFLRIFLLPSVSAVSVNGVSQRLCR